MIGVFSDSEAVRSTISTLPPAIASISSCSIRSVSLPGVPVALEVGDERGAVQAARLLERVSGHVAAERVDRLVGLAQRAPVGDQARLPRGAKLRRHLLDGGLDVTGIADCVGEEATVRGGPLTR